MQYFLTHSPVEFLFNKNEKNFVVEEIPLYEFSGSGEHLILTIRKKGLTTFDALKRISETVGVKLRDIGYAGLKDKDGMTIQNVSIPKNFADKINLLDGSDIKVLNTTYHNNKIKTGHLKGNRFYIKLKRVNPIDAKKIDEGIKKIVANGLPNYFGYQRFGRDGDNYLTGKAIIDGTKTIRNKEIRKLMINAYQSHLFNSWLSKRVEISKIVEEFNLKELKSVLNYSEDKLKFLKSQPQFFKLFIGDVMKHYPYGKLFSASEAEIERFANKDISPTGLLAGNNTMLSSDDAFEIEKEFVDKIDEFGDRRYAWIFIDQIEGKYREEEEWYELGFFLPKGSYATTLLRELVRTELNEIDI